MDDKTLQEAAREGNTFKLQQLLENDPLLLDRVIPLSTETPLHVAALAGQSEFVEELLRRAPWLAAHSNRHGLNALHMAAAKGHVDVVSALLVCNSELDLKFDAQGCVPLHFAAYYGRSEVVRVLVSRNFSVLKQVNFVGETALHVAVKSNQHGVMRVIEELLNFVGNDEFCEDVMMHMKDKYGYSVAKLLVPSSYKGNNLFQIYISKLGESGDEINNSNGVVSTETHPNELNVGDENETQLINTDGFLRQVVLAIMALIATVTFQALINPPQSLLKDGLTDSEQKKQDGWLLNFLVSNTVAFLISCWGLIAVFLRNELLMIIFWLGSSIAFVVLSYLYVLLPMIPGNHSYEFLTQFLISISVNLIISVVVYSRTFNKVGSKIKEYWKRSRYDRTATTNRANTNATVALSSGTSV